MVWNVETKPGGTGIPNTGNFIASTRGMALSLDEFKQKPKVEFPRSSGVLENPELQSIREFSSYRHG